jgi:hypothetical protein
MGPPGAGSGAGAGAGAGSSAAGASGAGAGAGGSSAGASLPHAATANTIANARSSASNFFILSPPVFLKFVSKAHLKYSLQTLIQKENVIFYTKNTKFLHRNVTFSSYVPLDLPVLLYRRLYK